MRIYHYKHDTEDPTKIAPALVGELETALGLKLQVDNSDNPNDVYGYLNTHGEGHVLVHLYDQEDVDRITAVHDDALGHAQHPERYRGIHKVHPITDQEVHDKIDTILSSKGYNLQ